MRLGRTDEAWNPFECLKIEIMNAKLRLHSRGKLSLGNTFVKWLSWSCRRWAGSSWGPPSAPCRPSSRSPTWAAGPPRRRTTPPRSGRPSPTAGSSWTAAPADPHPEPVEDHNWFRIRALYNLHFDIINLIWFGLIGSMKVCPHSDTLHCPNEEHPQDSTRCNYQQLIYLSTRSIY